MRCEDLRVELSAWIDGELSADDRARIAEHLRACSECSEHVRALQDTSSLVRALPAPCAPASITQAAMRHVSAMTRQDVSPRPRWRFSFAWPAPALAVGLVGLAAAITLAVFVGRPEQNGARYHLSSAPDSVTGTSAITPGYDFRGGQNRRDVSTFNARERYAWDHGEWHHERRFGRDGWWWEVEGAGYWYDKPENGPPAIVSDIRFPADSGSIGSIRQPPANAEAPPQAR